MLRERLKRRGLITTSAGVLATLSTTAEAAAPAHLVGSTTSAAMSAIAPLLHGAALSVTVSSGAIALTEGVLKAMSIAQLKLLGASAVIALGLLATGTEAVRAYQAPAALPGAAIGKVASQTGSPASAPGIVAPGRESARPQAALGATPAAPAGTGLTPGTPGGPGIGVGPDDSRRALAEQQIELARRGLAQVERLAQGGEAGPAELHRWAKRLLDARLALHPEGAEAVSALKDYVEQSRRWVQVVQNLHKTGEKTQLDVIDAELDLLNARLLLEKQSKQAAPALPGMGMMPPVADPPVVSAGGGSGHLPTPNPTPTFIEGERAAPQSTFSPIPAHGGTIPPAPVTVSPAGIPEGGMGGGGSSGRGRASGRLRKPNPLDEPRNKAIEEKLELVVDLQFKEETPLEDFLRFIKEKTKGKDGKEIPVYVDPKGLQEAECTLTSPVMIELEGVPLRTTLRLVLEQVGLRYDVVDGLLLITNESPEE
jgi:hypothetical protein